MQGATIKVLRGRLEEAIRAYENKIEKEYEDVRSARMLRNRKLVTLVKNDLTTKLAMQFRRYVDVNVEGPGRYSNVMQVGLRTNEKFHKLCEQVKKAHGFEMDKGADRKKLVCHSLGVCADGRQWYHGVHPETAHFFQPLLTKIDDEFVDGDAADIMAMIEAVIGKAK